MTRFEIEFILKEQKQYLRDQFSVEKIGIFGSYARDKQNENSDIDLLVEFSKPIGFEFIELKDYLESILQKPVDLVTERALKPYMKQEILDEVHFQ